MGVCRTFSLDFGAGSHEIPGVPVKRVERDPNPLSAKNNGCIPGKGIRSEPHVDYVQIAREFNHRHNIRRPR